MYVYQIDCHRSMGACSQPSRIRDRPWATRASAPSRLCWWCRAVPGVVCPRALQFRLDHPGPAAVDRGPSRARIRAM